ncbi:MAG: DNA-directed RNA polymerase subunit alpha [Puniceicoccales bacterium]|jgi:DNA-directed RNA polymerase subunit alpha|nr:DNA-directed RNA polymerase subunit alpha [Puniceicoccales bacterium]
MTRELGSFKLPTRLAKVEHTATDTYTMFIAEPFEAGFGHTIGNALRRILLGAIEGAALTNVRIRGVQHEFQPIHSVLEDVTEIIINLKKILFKTDLRESQTLLLDISGKDRALAEDIQLPEGVTILNPGNVICNLSKLHEQNKYPEFWAELKLSRGRGYRLSAENKLLDKSEGGIALDSAFSPVKLVKYFVENTRVGQDTDFERLVLEISTDGRISPTEAINEAVAILLHHFSVFESLKKEPITFEHTERKDGSEHNRLQKLLRMSVNEIELSVRAANCLNNANILTVGELASKSEAEMLKYRNFGKKSLSEIRDRLEELGLSLGMKIDEYV